jgi:hypothetical protein
MTLNGRRKTSQHDFKWTAPQAKNPAMTLNGRLKKFPKEIFA